MEFFSRTFPSGATPLEQFYLILPILISSTTLLQLPAASRALSKKWTALQMYDLQKKHSEEKFEAQPLVNQPHSVIENGMILLVLLFVCSPGIFLYLTSGVNFGTFVTAFRDNIIKGYVCASGLLLIYCFSPASSNLLIGRSKKGDYYLILGGDSNLKDSGEFLRFGAAALWIILTLSLPVESLILPSMIAIYCGRSDVQGERTYGCHMSFRKMILLPVLFLLVCGSMVVYLVTFQDETDFATSSGSKTVSVDWEMERADYVFRPFVWTAANVVATAFIKLAYRYDYTNTGSTSTSQLKDAFTLEEVKGSDSLSMTVAASSQVDSHGKRPILISSVPFQALSTQQAPIYTTGLITFCAMHGLSIFFSLVLPLQDQISKCYCGQSPSFLAINSLHALYGTGWIAGILVPAAMLIRAFFTKEGALKLWHYREKWELDVNKEGELEEKAGLEEQAQSLLDDMDCEANL